MGNTRSGMVDLLRGLSAAGIVWFHAAAPDAWVGLSGLTVFFIQTILLCPGPGRPLGAFLAGRLDRMIRPWLIWSVILALAKASQATLSGRALTSEFEGWMLLSGPGLHLWFLPFAFCCLVALTLAERAVRLPRGLLLAACIAAVPLSHLLTALAGGHPFREWAAALAPVTVALALRAGGSAAGDRWKILGATLLSGGLGYGLQGDAMLPVLLGTALVVVTGSVSLRDRPFFRWIGLISMPVYLVHPMFLAVLDATPLADQRALLAALALTLSVALGEAVRRAGLFNRLF